MNKAVVKFRRRTISGNSEIVMKRYSLSYSRTTHDDRDFNFHQFHNFWNIALSEKKVGLAEAKARIYRTRYNTSRYNPSREYLAFIKLLKERKVLAIA